MIKGPIIIVEDDIDDQEIFEEVIRDLDVKNEIKFFNSGRETIDYLMTTEDQPFIILSDVNMPQMSGLQLKKYIQDDPYLRAKGIPFVFISTDSSKPAVRHAHSLSVQGFFQKPNDFKSISKIFDAIFSYWTLSRHINSTFA